MIKLYNTLTRKKEEFKPITNKKVNLFVCGITPYDLAHIGHARTYVVFDMIAKYLKEKGFEVHYLQNVTDIDDKIINRAKEKNISPEQLAQDFEKEYHKNMEELKVDSVERYVKATDNIEGIINQIKRLEEKGFTYKIEDGIYYDISKFKNYGKLSKRTAEQAEDGVSRIDDGKGKKNKGDFCLWKFSKPEEPKWESPWGEGRPGWHIEDTAIAEKYFGEQYDIHGGGKDLMFPHHEAEIAQMEAISNKYPFVKYWLHTGFLTINGRKMSKSLGNFITINDLLRNHSPRILRFFILKFHYRSSVDYSENAILQTKEELGRIDEFVTKLKEIQNNKNAESKKVNNLVSDTKKKFEKAMKDDFNTPIAISSIFELINKCNTLIRQDELEPKNAGDILAFLREIDKFLCLNLDIGKISWKLNFEEKIGIKDLPLEIKKLTEQRKKSRKEKNWKEADEIRDKLAKLGYQIEDTKDGLKIKKI